MANNTQGGEIRGQAYFRLNSSQPAILYKRPSNPTIYTVAGYNIGDFWLNTESETLFQLMSTAATESSGGLQIATWAEITTSSGSVNELDADTGSALPVGGIIDIVGGTNINTSATGNTVTVNLDNSITLTGNLNMPDTNTGGTAGVINWGGFRYISNFGTDNTFIGKSSGNTTVTGTDNVGIGEVSLQSITTGARNCALGTATLNNATSGTANCAMGQGALTGITTGSLNVCIGEASGSNYTSSESSNICIGSAGGTLGESNVLRIGSGTGTSVGQLNKAIINGISGINVGSTANVVSINTGTGQLGTTAITAGSNITVTPGANTITIAASAPVSGAMQLIQTRTASAVTELTFTSGISTTFKTYMITFRSLQEATASNTDAFVQLSTDGGGTYITTGYRNNNAADAGLQITNLADSASLGFGTAYLYNMTSGVGYVSSNTVATVSIPATSSLANGANATYETANITVNALRIRMADNAAFSGTFSLYSIAE